jgi:hypothetical protein
VRTGTRESRWSTEAGAAMPGDRVGHSALRRRGWATADRPALGREAFLVNGMIYEEAVARPGVAITH